LDRRGMLVTILAMGFFVIYLWWSNPFQSLVEVGRFDITLYAVAIALDYLGLLLFVASWYLIIRVLGIQLSFWESIQITFTSLFIGWIAPIPMNTEIVRAYIVKDKTGSNMGKAISSVLVHRAYYNIAFSLIVAITAFTLVLTGRQIPIQIEIVWLLLAFAIVSSGFFSLVLNPNFLEKIYNKSPEWVKRRIFNKIYDSSKSSSGFHGFITEIEGAVTNLKSNPGLNLLAFTFVATHWFLGTVTIWVVALSMGVYLDIWITVFIYATIEFIQQLNWVVPSGLGVVDAGLTAALLLSGVPLSLAAAISLLIRFSTNWVELLTYAPVAFNYGYVDILKQFKQQEPENITI
jgi:uncharacterized protein (TIRG00374 family)